MVRPRDGASAWVPRGLCFTSLLPFVQLPSSQERELILATGSIFLEESGPDFSQTVEELELGFALEARLRLANSSPDRRE